VPPESHRLSIRPNAANPAPGGRTGDSIWACADCVCLADALHRPAATPTLALFRYEQSESGSISAKILAPFTGAPARPVRIPAGTCWCPPRCDLVASPYLSAPSPLGSACPRSDVSAADTDRPDKAVFRICFVARLSTMSPAVLEAFFFCWLPFSRCAIGSFRKLTDRVFAGSVWQVSHDPAPTFAAVCGGLGGGLRRQRKWWPRHPRVRARGRPHARLLITDGSRPTDRGCNWSVPNPAHPGRCRALPRSIRGAARS